jgi:perosamine synthetase
MIAQGRKVAEFEKMFAEYAGVKGAVAVNSGTSALHLSLIALGIKNGDEVIIPSYVCTALLNAINYVGARAVLADIDRESFNISLLDVRNRITDKTRAIIVPHMFGTPCSEIDAFRRLGIPVIEDCAQSLGARITGRHTGTIGDIGIFSFYATKVITTAEGGMVISRSEELIDKIRDLRDYDNKEKYRVRFNYKMTDINAALGVEQLKKLPGFIEKRNVIAGAYEEAFRDLPVGTSKPAPDVDKVWFRYVLSLENATELISFLNKEGIGAVRPIFKPLHRFFNLMGDYPVTENAWETSVSIPIYPSLSSVEVEKIINTIYDFFR